jgi:hypothetical protein
MIKNRELIKQIKAYGFTLVREKRHLVFTHPCGATLVTSQTASDRRFSMNVERDARRLLRSYGIEPPAIQGRLGAC